MLWPTMSSLRPSPPKRSLRSKKGVAVLLNEVIKARLSAYGINVKRVSTKYGDMTMKEHRLLTDPDERGIPHEWLVDMVNREQASRNLKGRNDHKF